MTSRQSKQVQNNTCKRTNTTSSKQHDTPHTQNYNIVNKNWRDQQHNSENKHPEESCHAKLLICNAKNKILVDVPYHFEMSPHNVTIIT